MDDQRAKLEWRDGVPVSTRFEDPYFSLENGMAETAHVFLTGNGLPERFADGFSVAELGFGTGLNFLVTWDAWEHAGVPGRFAFTSFEAYPMSPEDMAQALAAFPTLADKARALVEAVDSGPGPYELGPADLRLVRGDARVALPRADLRADAWYLDGFAPLRNPELWGEDILRAVARATVPGGTFATYTAAGHVRRGLQAAGFEVERVPGYGRKRHMSVGRKP